MADYYDPYSWTQLTPEDLLVTGDSGGWFRNPTGGVTEATAGLLPGDSDYYSRLNGAGNYGPDFGTQLQKIAAENGWTPAQLAKNYNDYVQGRTGTSVYNDATGGTNWWGGETGKRAYLSGFGGDAVGKYIDPALEEQQQKGLGSTLTAAQQRPGDSDMESFMDALKGAGFVLGAGMGLNGLYGVEGLGAGGAAGAGDVFGMGYGGYGPPDAVGGIVGGGAGAEAGVPGGDATGAAPDALDGMQGFTGFNGSPAAPGVETPAAPVGGETGGTPAGQPVGTPAAAPETGLPETGGLPIGGGEGAGAAPGADPLIPTPEPVGAPVTDIPAPGGAGAGRSVGPGGVMPAPVTDLSAPAGLADNARLGVQGIVDKVPSGVTSTVQKALDALGITDSKGGIGKNALSIAGLGLSQYNAGKNRASLSKDLTAAAAPASEAARRLLEQGLAGQAPAAIIAAADKTLNDRTQEVIQRYSNMGRDARTDTGAAAEISKLKVARDAAIAQYAQTMTSQGLQAAGIAQGPTTQAAVAGAQQDKDLSNSIAQMLQQMAMMQALQGRNTGATT